MTDSPEPRKPAAKSSPHGWRFSLTDLLLWTTVLAGFLGLVYWLGPAALVVASFLAIGFLIFLSDWQSLGILMISLGVAVVLLGGALLTMEPRVLSRRSICSTNLKQIALALLQYETVHGAFPPAYFVDDQGRPTHSWRAMILKELGRPDLAAAYRWDEPWDGPNNRLLHDQAIKILRCPSDSQAPPHCTNYVAIVGPGTVFPGEQSVSALQITDAPSSTLLVVEVHNSGIGWFEPRDLHVAQMAPRINSKQGQGPSSAHPGGVNVAFVDGGVQFLPDDLPPEELRKMATIEGGETVTVP